MSVSLCLGTVQFGLPYGITNQAGQVSEKEVRRILHLAAKSGIDFLDTAQSYGSAEYVVGNCWPPDVPRRLISKLSTDSPSEVWEESFYTSLKRLKTNKLDSFLLHNSSDLLGPNSELLLNWLDGLRTRGLVDRIGVSIYEASDLEGLPLNRLQLVQLPLSIYDQRLIRDGTVERLKDLGIAVHARSVFLQGLLLQSPSLWPSHLSPTFRDHHARWLESLYQHGSSPLAASLGFVRDLKGIEAALVGVLSSQELDQILQAWNQTQFPVPESAMDPAWENAVDLDPRCWTSP